MYIKSVNYVSGYKGLPEGFSCEFGEMLTYIIGDNFQGKTTVGSLFNWCLTNTSLDGKEKEQVANDKTKVQNVIVDITFIDNFGIEHRLVREKGKEINLLLDGKEIKQEILAQFYKDKDIFLVSYNPYYFVSLEPKEQKNLLRKILPVISPENVFKFLDKSEQLIIKEPIENLNSYADSRNREKSLLENEYNRNDGSLQAYRTIALKSVGEVRMFEKEETLKKLQEKYKELSSDIGTSNIEDIQRNIQRINKRLQEIINDKLRNITDSYNKENNKLNNIDKDISICPSCRQEIKGNETKEHLKRFYKKELGKLQEKADMLKIEAKQLIEERQNKKIILEKLNTMDMQEIIKEKEKLKQQIDILQEEKNNILLNNKEVQIRQAQVTEAKKNIEILEKAQEEILKDIEICKMQKKIADKLKILVIEAQKEKIRKYLNKVDIQFSKINKTTGEIIECCNIQYDGRDFKKTSKSQQARALLEISNLFNNLSEIKAPVFFDDAESTTDIEQMPNAQMIISLVIKDNPLEILYDYAEVLNRKEVSIKKELQDDCNYILKQVA